MNFFTKNKYRILENACSYIVVFAMVTYGFGKTVQFNGATNIPKPVSELTGMQLMWAFYGYSKPFVYTIGVLEIIGGILLLLKRTRLIGCLLVSTILINIILQDIFYDVNMGALRAAIFYQAMILFIFYFNRIKIIATWNILTKKVDNQSNFKNNLLVLLLSGFSFILLRIAEYYLTSKW
ncbi:DoxX family protein [Flavihumibacter sp. RY-1]|uniref:DoxX family protein n=1 Tax=Flavihumibacter fluminis TaxID=2909236 RepID=A0ABS9BCD2_9BACT|nr:DoxX family protein [Flavihumibacter fluminis]MCF1713279.1 DoxX family protein [Flavihumibacter fluminis]